MLSNFICCQYQIVSLRAIFKHFKLILMNVLVPLLLIGYENHKIEINVRLHNVTENTDKVNLKL